MNRYKHILGGVIGWIGMMSGGGAWANVVSFSDMTASWSNVIGGQSVAYESHQTVATVRWGQTATSNGEKSGYRFEAGDDFATTLQQNISPDFVLGTFTHSNKPILTNSSIEGIRLTITAQVTVNGLAQGPKNFIYDFIHDETPNDPATGVCANGGPNGQGINSAGCADKVMVNFNQLSDSFSIGEDVYSLEIRGFLSEGALFEEFWTVEERDNRRSLAAGVSLWQTIQPDPQQISAPAVLTTFGMGLFGIMRGRRRRS